VLCSGYTDREELDHVTDAWTEGGTGVTIKEGKGYEESWFTFRGTPAQIKEDLIQFFGLDSASVADWTVHAVASHCKAIAHGIAVVATELGAAVIADGPSENLPASSTPSPTEDAPAESPLLARIAATTDAESLKRLWAENQDAFKDATVMNAWKARGKALQNAA
jgi:hypothetical protein